MMLLTQVGHNRARRVFLHAAGIAHHKEDADADKDDEHDDAQHQALANGNPGRLRPDAGGKGVDRGSGHPQASAQGNRGHGGHGIVAQPQKEHNNDGIKTERFLTHAEGSATKGEEHHQHGDQEDLTSLERFRNTADASRNGARFHGHGDKGADHQHEEGDPDRAVERAFIVDRDIACLDGLVGIILWQERAWIA